MKIVTFIHVYSPEDCDGEKKMLLEAACRASYRAYAPYSGFRVGCAVLLSNGEVIEGANQENVAYSPTQCAERTAILYANAQFPEVPVVAIAIAAQKDGVFTSSPCTPCGVCRQVLSEVERRFGKDLTIWMYGTESIYEASSARSLLPLCFGDRQEI